MLRCCAVGPVAVRLTVAVAALTMRQVLERHATHGSPKLEFAVLQELLEELGFEFTPGDIALVNRQFDNKNTGWVTYRDLVRFMTAGYSAVQVRALFRCSRPRVPAFLTSLVALACSVLMCTSLRVLATME